MVLPAFSEWAGPGSSAQFALNYTSRTDTTTRTELGAWFTYDLPLADQALKLYSRFAYAHDFTNEGVTSYEAPTCWWEARFHEAIRILVPIVVLYS